jgi:hypothetical protein
MPWLSAIPELRSLVGLAEDECKVGSLAWKEAITDRHNRTFFMEDAELKLRENGAVERMHGILEESMACLQLSVKYHS